jgi:hypothetical protein
MNWGKSFLAGVIGAVLITAILAVAIGIGLKVLDFSMMWGTIVGLPVGAAAWIIGFCIHLLVGGLFGLFYLAIFKAFSGAGVLRGATLGFVQAVITGMIIALLPMVDAAVDRGLLHNSGAYFSRGGVAGIVVYFGIHLVYGAVVGWLCARWIAAFRITKANDNEHEHLRIAA